MALLENDVKIITATFKQIGASIDGLLAETKRLGEVVIELSNDAEQLEARHDRMATNVEARLGELGTEQRRIGDQLEQDCSKLRRHIDENDERADRLEGLIARKHIDACEHTDKAVHDLEIDVGSVASDLADLRGEVPK